MTDMRLCFMGDSLTVGVGDSAHRGWPGRVCDAKTAEGHDLTLYNLGVRAETSADIRHRWRRECEPRLSGDGDGRLVFCFGVNDTVELPDGSVKVAPVESLVNARAILEKAVPWKPTLWIGPPPAPDMGPDFIGDTPYDAHATRVAALNKAYGALAAELNVAYLDVFTPLAADGRWAAHQTEDGDGVHPSADGYALLADIVMGWDAWRAWFHD